MPFVPEERQGELVVMALVCFAGAEEDADRVLAPFRSVAEPIVDMVQPISYPEIYGPEPEDYHPTVAFRNMFIDQVDAAQVIERLESAEPPMKVAQFRVLGGAIDRVPGDATAYAHRGAAIMTNLVAFYEDPADAPAREAWVDEFAGELRTGDAAYANFLGDEGPERVRAAYPGDTWDRLTRVKAQYDPENLFRGNQNIPPAQS